MGAVLKMPPYDDSDKPPPKPRLVPRPDPRREQETRPPALLPSHLQEEVTTDLRRYLKESRDSVRVASDERAEIRTEIREANRRIANLANMYELHDRKDEDRHKEVTGMLKGHEARINAVERDAEDTGSWVVKEQKRRKWWRTRAARLGFKILEWAVIGAIAWAVGHFYWR